MQPSGYYHIPFRSLIRYWLPADTRISDPELNTGLAFILLLLVLDMKGNGLTANKQDQQRFHIKTATGMKDSKKRRALRAG